MPLLSNMLALSLNEYCLISFRHFPDYGDDTEFDFASDGNLNHELKKPRPKKTMPSSTRLVAPVMHGLRRTANLYDICALGIAFQWTFRSWITGGQG